MGVYMGQTIAADKAHQQKDSFTERIDSEHTKVSDIRNRNFKTSIFQNRRTEFRAKVKLYLE
jgi:hypothetical protein